MEKEPHWIGHRTAERRQTESGYEYRDPDNQSLAIMLGVPDFHAKGTLFDGADLWEVDRFVEGLEARNDPAAEKYRARLNLIRELHRNGNLKACLPHADVINAGMQAQAQLEREHRHREALEIACALSAQRPLPDPPPQQAAAVPKRDTTTAPSAESAGNAEAERPNAAASVGASEAVPAPLPSPAIANAFDGLNSWDFAQWAKALGDGRNKWLNDARVRQGRPGVDAATWNPVTIALALKDKGAAWPRLDAVFKRPALKAWREKWERDTEPLRE